MGVLRPSSLWKLITSEVQFCTPASLGKRFVTEFSIPNKSILYGEYCVAINYYYQWAECTIWVTEGDIVTIFSYSLVLWMGRKDRFEVP